MDLSDPSVAPGTTITDIQVLSTNHTIKLTPYAQNPSGINMGLTTDMQFDALGRTLLTSLDGRIHLIDSAGDIQATPWITTPSADGFANLSEPFDYGLTSIALHPDFHNTGSAGYGKFYTVEANNTPPAGGFDSDFDHPFYGYHENGTIFTKGEHESVLAEYTTTAPGASTLSLGTDTTRRVLATFHQEHHGHNIGDLAFGPDNLLYVTSGDGGNATDYENNSSSPDNAYGKILRIDPLTLTNTADRSVFSVDGEARFSVPTDNPHYDGGTIGAEDMVFVYGARNPYRISFDGDDAYVSETGQANIESIKSFNVSDVLSGDSAGDFGWGLLEGSFIYLGNHSSDSTHHRVGGPTNLIPPTSVGKVLADYDPVTNPNPMVQFITHPNGTIANNESGTTRNTAIMRELTDEEVARLLAIVNGPVNDLPVFEYDQTDGVSPIGGFVYRGSELPELYGQYIFGEFQGVGEEFDEEGRTVGDGGRLLYGDPTGTPGSNTVFQMLIDPDGEELPYRITGFAQDANGELILVGIDETFSGVLLSITATVAELLAGDYNGNGIVDAADYTVWQDSFGSTTDLAADGNGNGVIDAADYTVWQDNFGNTNLPASTIIPEPSVALCLLAPLLMTSRRSGRCSRTRRI
ncbi:PQQ-dependent sugar dehydrogenase [Algisphaera agarilytica]|nr:PQQ-dependent sugar dehydrogenase [Algisphaera agarilytica]